MEANSSTCDDTAISQRTLNEVITLLWGSDIKHDVFQRWNQGFIFSDTEPTALLQNDGGPCAVIVPVQAFLLKNLLFLSSLKDEWRQCTGAERERHLCTALADVLTLVQSSNAISLVYSLPPSLNSKLSVDQSVCSATSEDVSATTEGTEVNESRDVTMNDAPLSEHASSSPKRKRFSHEQFHSELRVKMYMNNVDLCSQLVQHLPMLMSDSGVLLFLYSIMLTKGVEQLKREIGEVDEPMIDCIHGHGSQSLINLLITGKAVSHVWDNEKDISGLKLQGISSKSDIGFLTLLEHLRYCEVGWYLKNPMYPIWLVGSETHLTILFSKDKTLVGEESPELMARRVFSQFDADGRGFISADSLGDLMRQLDLVSMPEYVKIMAEKLDPEQLGVITLSDFMDEFFASAKQRVDAIQSFNVYHYNGLQRSCLNNKVVYAEASCVITDMPELQMISDFSPIKTCLLTKWPTIDLTWKNGTIPSIN